MILMQNVVFKMLNVAHSIHINSKKINNTFQTTLYKYVIPFNIHLIIILVTTFEKTRSMILDHTPIS